MHSKQIPLGDSTEIFGEPNPLVKMIFQARDDQVYRAVKLCKQAERSGYGSLVPRLIYQSLRKNQIENRLSEKLDIFMTFQIDPRTIPSTWFEPQTPPEHVRNVLKDDFKQYGGKK